MRDDNPKTVGDLLTAYIADRRKHVDHIGPLESNAKALREFFGDRTIDEVCERNVLRNLCHDYAQLRGGLAVNTIRKQLVVLQSSLRLAWKRGVIKGLPHMWIPDAPKITRRPLSTDDRNAILTAADSYPTQAHIRTFVYIALFTGQHAGNVVRLKWKDVNFREGLMTFPKRDGTKEKVSMHPRLRGVLERADEAKESDYVVEWRGKPVQKVYHSMKVLLERAGVKELNSLDLRKVESGVDESDEADDESYVFISYCRRDGSEHANLLAQEFRKIEQPYWLDHEHMGAGNYSAQLSQAVKGSTGVIVVLTQGANDSADVLQEVARARTANIEVLPISVEHVKLGPELRHLCVKAHEIDWEDAETTAAKALQTLGVS